MKNYNTKYIQNLKLSIPNMDKKTFSICLGLILGDASIQKKGNYPFLKLEQGYMHKNYLYHLYEVLEMYTFTSPRIRLHNSGEKKDNVKSYEFKTFSHPTFNELYSIFIKNNKKSINYLELMKYLEPISLAYWIMDDGSLGKDNSMIIHTQSFTKIENEYLKTILNEKFNLNCKVISHKNIYWVLFIPRSSKEKLYLLIVPYIIESMKYKLPKVDDIV